ncbi:hypothetical protein TcasGA2_TC032599 [Tribolium castaneum]|uniref:Uncharacterized protein n=1 Tax=Tribolium castaneum TaxID=7070 RepID=A0A139WK50_TRICA|nr:hypothetical protein TcasGA2_TC032599 [Tribolium castaneum]
MSAEKCKHSSNNDRYDVKLKIIRSVLYHHRVPN